MDQIATGKFIRELRKERGLTQQALADRLSISEKTVSKWETGKGLPEVGLMLPLCDALQITVNELLSGKRLNGATFRQQAEENVARLLQARQEAKKKLAVCIALCAVSLLAGVALVLTAGLAEMQTWARILLLCVALFVVGGQIAIICVIDREAGSFECPHCKARFVPTMKQFVLAPHTFTRRRLQCPHCGRTSYCRRRLDKS